MIPSSPARTATCFKVCLVSFSVNEPRVCGYLFANARHGLPCNDRVSGVISRESWQPDDCFCGDPPCEAACGHAGGVDGTCLLFDRRRCCLGYGTADFFVPMEQIHLISVALDRIVVGPSFFKVLGCLCFFSCFFLFFFSSTPNVSCVIFVSQTECTHQSTTLIPGFAPLAFFRSWARRARGCGRRSCTPGAWPGCSRW